MLNDLKFALRMFARNRTFTAVAICSLAIGIGANSAIFSFADALLLRPLPVARANRIATVTSASANSSADDSISYPDYRDFRDLNSSFDGLIAYQYGQFGYAPKASAVPEMKFGAFVSGNFFRVLGAEPTLGRGFRADEDQAPGRNPVAVLSHAFWLSEFHGDPAAVGSSIRLNGVEFKIVGVASRSFENIDQFLRPALFVPIAMYPALSGSNVLEKRDANWLVVKGVLKPGVTRASAAANLDAITKALRRRYSSEPRDRRIRVEDELQLRARQSPPDADLVEMLALLAICVLLVACANVAGLLLSRATVREREIAVRLAVGAARRELIRQLFLENLLLAMAGGALGIGVALAGMKLFASIPIPSDLPVSFGIELDHRVLIFTLAASIASAFLFGLLPAWRSSRVDIIPALKARGQSRGPRSLWGRNLLVGSQLAVSCILLILAAFIFIGFHSRITQGPGFETDHLFLMGFDSSMVHYSKQQNVQFYKDLLDQTRRSAGVRSAALTSVTPFGFDNDSRPVIVEGRNAERGKATPSAFDAVVSDGYFATMHIPIERGRGFAGSDKADSRKVAVVNERFAHHFWPTEDAIGKRFRLDDAKGTLLEVVGIARDAKYIWISEPPTDFFYLPFSQQPHSVMTLVAESYPSDASVLAPVLRGVVHTLDPRMPVFDVRTMQDLFEKRGVQTPRIITQAIAGMGGMALILAVIGLYGLITYSVDQRRREIGIRMAVGADPRRVLRVMLRQAFLLAVCGLGAGMLLGIGVARLMRSSFFFAGNGANPALLIVLLLPLLGIALLAAYAPARRASRIDPIRVLREE